MKQMFAALVLSLCLCQASVADCPTTATCAEHGIAGNPTGAYKWQGATEYAQFSHPMTDGTTHLWWEKCE
jgi:hypothetical protein